MKNLLLRRLFAFTGALLFLVGWVPTVRAQHTHHPADSTEAMRVAMHFHEALAQGDSTTVAGLLADEAVILESGEAETRIEYLSTTFMETPLFCP